jgi:hypothetical protein
MPVYVGYKGSGHGCGLGSGILQLDGDALARKSKSPTTRKQTAVARRVSHRIARAPMASTATRTPIRTRSRPPRQPLGHALPAQDATEPAITRQTMTHGQVSSRTAHNGQSVVRTSDNGPGDCLTPEEIMRFFNGELDRRQLALAKKHLRVCKFCEAQVDALNDATNDVYRRWKQG